LSLAYFLAKENKFDITIIEKSNKTGGLAGSTVLSNGITIDSFYHHIFLTDSYFIDLYNEILPQEPIFFEKSTTGHFYDNQLHDISDIKTIFKSELFSNIEFFRFIFASAFIKYFPEKIYKGKIASRYSRFLFGNSVYNKVWKPLLMGKFGEYSNILPMSWLAARIKDRTFRLGYPRNGFFKFYKELEKSLRSKGVTFIMNQSVESVNNSKHRIEINSSPYDFCISTLGPLVDSHIHQETLGTKIPYLYLSAICIIFEMSELLDIPYWINYCDNNSEILAVINHCKLDKYTNYEGIYPVYVASYLNPTHFLHKLSDEELAQYFYKHLLKLLGNSYPKKLPKYIVNRSKYAQPIINPDLKLPPINHISKQFMSCSMHSIYPNDRGQNYSIKYALKASSYIASLA